ncbi:MAG: hypothetical protein U0Q18_23180 [Bryobacteraceae bacterium]
MRALLPLISCFCLAAAERPWTEEYPVEASAANKVCQGKDYGACRTHLVRLMELLDGRVDIAYKLAKAEAGLGRRDEALKWLAVYSKSGLTFADPSSDPVFAGLRAGPAFAALTSALATAHQPVTSSQLFTTLSQNDLVVEDIAYDPAGQRFYVSSVRHRKILSIDRTGKETEFLPEGQPGVWSVMALAVDSQRRYLWASTVATPEAIGYRSADEGRSALLKYSVDTGKFLKRYDLPAGAQHALGDMTVSAAGDVYVSDGHGPVYWVDHAKDTLQPLIEPGTFRSPQTPALSPDQRRLFVPDYSRGISIVDLGNRRTALLAHPPELSLGGIDGLYLAGRTMLAIQNGTEPERIIRMQLDPSLTRITSWEIVEANWPELGDPTHGVIVGQQFYYIANSGWDKFGDGGVLKPGAAFTPATIRVMPLNGNSRKR